MTQHINDAFGDETPRPRDTAPAEEVREPVEVERTEVERTEASASAPDSAPKGEGAEARSEAPSEAPVQRPRRKAARTSKPRAKKATELAATPRAEGRAGDAMRDLAAQGFSEVEARRLIHISDRAAQSSEAREAEATLRRLRFTRWLVERGRLDEWSA